MLKELNADEEPDQSQWLSAFWKGKQPTFSRVQCYNQHTLTFLFLFLSADFRRRFLSLLSYQFSSFHPSLALSILQNRKSKEEKSSKSSAPGHLPCCFSFVLKR